MALETAAYISQLVSTNPVVTDDTGQGDDHLRLIKSALLATFPNFTAAALNSTQAEIDAAVAATGSSGILKISEGLVGAPAYSFNADPTTGLWQPATGKLTGSLSGTKAFEFSSTGLDLLIGSLALDVGSITLTAGDITLIAGDVNLAAGAYKLNGTDIFPIQAGNIGAGQVGNTALATNAVKTANILDANVTYAKIQNVAASKLLGNSTGAATAPAEIGLGANFSFSSGNIEYTPPNPFQMMQVQEQQPQNTASTCTVGSVWTTLVFNTTVFNNITGAARTGNVVSLPAGTYKVTGCAPFGSNGGVTKMRVRNTTDNVTLVSGPMTSGSSSNASGIPKSMSVLGVFTLAAAKNVEAQGFCSGSTSAGPSNTDIETYSNMVIEKIA